MIVHKLEKEITLYKNQFEKFVFDIFQNHCLERLSIELDALLFRIKYMVRNNKDLDKLPQVKEEFVQSAMGMRSVFGEFMYSFLIHIVELGEFKKEDILDIMAQEVKIDNIFVKFKMILISTSKEYLEYVDNRIDSNETFNMFPNEFFRFTVDSYNDGIAKAYPELFEKKEQQEVGVGRDSDVFCHSFTFQTTEDCSLSCLYCLGRGTKILMSDRSTKNIEDIQVGDIVMGFEEYKGNYRDRTLFPTMVTKIFKRNVQETYLIKSPFVDNGLKITNEHPMLTDDGWKQVNHLHGDDRLIITLDNKNFVRSQYTLQYIPSKTTVYNLETDSHTYVANQFCVHNCYQFNKTPMVMEFDTAKKFIDELLNDKYGYINRHNSPAIILEFIGGEPLLQMKLTRKIYEYFLKQCYEMNHPWFKLHRLSICSNGLQYFNDDVQRFFRDYISNISFNISIDGNKELHDSCRIQPNREGSYDIAMAALNHFNKHHSPERNSKMTLAPENMKYLYESVVSFIENGMKTINLNCVFEEGWNQETALLEYNELKKVADYLIDNNLEHLYISIFNERQEDISGKEFDGPFCGGSGAMLALRPNGQFYPCIRYMPTSVGDDVKDLCIGDVKSGMVGREEDSDVLQLLDRVTRRSYSNDICYDCPIGNDCAVCVALGHTVFGTPNKRPTFTCIQMIAEALANVYFWNVVAIKKPHYQLPVRKNNVPEKWALLVIDEEELEGLKFLELTAMMVKIQYEKFPSLFEDTYLREDI